MPASRSLVLVLALVLVAAFGAAVPAAGSQLVYECGQAFENLCVAGPDGSGTRPLTTDGDASRASDHVYRGAGLSRDGSRLAYIVDFDVFIRDMATGATVQAHQQNAPHLVRFSPDAGRFAVAEEPALLLGNQLCSYDTGLMGDNEGRYCLGTGLTTGMDYLPDGRLVMSATGDGGRTEVKLLRPEDGGQRGSERTLVADAEANLESPSVSPDGTLVAVARVAPGGSTEGDIALYDLGSGALVRTLTSGGGGASPSFSPDGREIAFGRGDAIWIVAVAGGAPRRVIERGRSVSWGGGASPQAAPTFSALRVAARQRGTRIRASVRIARPGARVTVELLAGGRRVGRSSQTLKSAGRFLFRVLLNRRGRARLSRARVLGLTVRMTVTEPGAVPQRATRHVTLRPPR